jgi:cytochrome c oxidase assembly protein subunit 15
MNEIIDTHFKNKIISTWLGILCILIISMVSLGGYTRLTNSGLSITEWQPISGIIPPSNEQDWQIEFGKYQDSPEFQQINNDITISEFKHIYVIEFAHRILGRVIGMALILPFLYLAFSGYFSQKEVFIYLFAIILLFAQGLMGWYMVQSGLINEPHVSHFRLSAHLLLACLLYMILLWQFLHQFRNNIIVKRTKNFSLCLRLILLSNLLILIQIVLGGFVAGLKAGLIYNEFPLMDGSFIPPELHNIKIDWSVFSHPVFVQFLHRLTAYLVLIINIILYIRIRKLANIQLNRAAIIMLLITTIQALVGILTLIYVVPLNLAMIHQFGAMILLSSSVWVAYLLNTNSQ